VFVALPLFYCHTSLSDDATVNIFFLHLAEIFSQEIHNFIAGVVYQNAY